MKGCGLEEGSMESSIERGKGWGVSYRGEWMLHGLEGRKNGVWFKGGNDGV